MKRFIALFVSILLVFSALTILSSCDSEPEASNIPVISEEAQLLYSDNGYIDYADTVYFDAETYPELQEEGLFWTRWNSETEEIELVPADSTEGAALINPANPTIINVHGILMDGYEKPERFLLNTKIANPSEFDLDTEDVSMLYLWIREGWNVGVFHYNRFAAESNVKNTEAKIWAVDGEAGIRFHYSASTKSETDISPYCLAEHFAAEYIRAANLINGFGQSEIRIAAHSMGGELSTASIFLLTELSKAGQLPESQLPDRFAMLDPYFSTYINAGASKLYMGPTGITIKWSGKTCNDTNRLTIEAVKAIAANGIAIEYYTFAESFLSFGVLNIWEELRPIATYSLVNPNFQGEGYTVLIDGHNGVREWYLCSLLENGVPDISESEVTAYAPSAAMSTAQLLAIKGNAYKLIAGDTTVNASDDACIRMYSVYYDLDGGANGAGNLASFTAEDNLTFAPASKTGFTFVGWYDNPEFAGEAITSISGSRKADIKLYAKYE